MYITPLFYIYSNVYSDADWQAIGSGQVATYDDGSAAFALRKVKEFLVYLTMKACSIMVCLQPADKRYVLHPGGLDEKP